MYPIVTKGNEFERSPREQESRDSTIQGEHKDDQTETKSKKEIRESQTFAQIRPQMSAFFFTASSRPALGRRLRRRLGGRLGLRLS